MAKGVGRKILGGMGAFYINYAVYRVSIKSVCTLNRQALLKCTRTLWTPYILHLHFDCHPYQYVGIESSSNGLKGLEIGLFSPISGKI